MPWTDDWVGLPHVKRGRTRKGCDCLGLARLIYHDRFGVWLPEHGEDADAARKSDLTQRHRPLYSRVTVPQEGDFALFTVYRSPMHVGYIVGGGFMLHSEANVGSTLARWDRNPWLSRLEGLYRYAF